MFTCGKLKGKNYYEPQLILSYILAEKNINIIRYLKRAMVTQSLEINNNILLFWTSMYVTTINESISVFNFKANNIYINVCT